MTQIQMTNLQKFHVLLWMLFDGNKYWQYIYWTRNGMSDVTAYKIVNK